jgi:hypothetical protein
MPKAAVAKKNWTRHGQSINVCALLAICQHRQSARHKEVLGSA